MAGDPWRPEPGPGRCRGRISGCGWGWIFDIVRDRPDLQDEVVDISLAARDRGVVALGLAGDERLDSAATFQPGFDAAAAAGLPGIPHTGELSGPDKMWEVIRLLAAAAPAARHPGVEDPALVGYLREHGIGCDVCPTSNVRLGVYRQLRCAPAPPALGCRRPARHGQFGRSAVVQHGPEQGVRACWWTTSGLRRTSWSR